MAYSSRLAWRAVLLALPLAVLVAGCQTDKLTADPKRDAPEGPVTALENPPGVQLPTIPLAGRTEVDLVEELVLHRAMYARYLRALATFYTENGYEEKAKWARSELRDLQKIKPYQYVMDAEVPVASLRPTESIAEADQLFQEARQLMDKAGHRVLFLYHNETMNRALGKFKELIAKYPNSDKIASAAYYIGEIHKEYGQERDNTIAIEWLKRAIDWDPNLNHPAWSRIAHIYDFRMHEREKALEWYQKVLENEKGKTGPTFLGNIDFANKRIAQLTTEKTREAPGEPTPDGRPAPTGSAEPGAAADAGQPQPK